MASIENAVIDQGKCLAGAQGFRRILEELPYSAVRRGKGGVGGTQVQSVAEVTCCWARAKDRPETAVDNIVS